MSIVNQLSYSNRMRDRLSNNRNGFTYGANITVLFLAVIFFSTLNDAIFQFRLLCLIGLILGSCSSMFYLFKIREIPLSKQAM